MSSEAQTLSTDQIVWQPKVNPWVIGITVSLAAFLEVLDTSIANVALPYIAGNLGASYDNSTWVLTSYLAANAIVLPISGWLAEVIGRKRYFLLSLVVFTLSSLLCGLAPSLPMLLLFRAVQGVGGGGLQPMAQAIINDTFPPEKRGLAFALYGITAVLAPTVGPMLGGWITDNYSWRWIFFIKIPIAALAVYLTYELVEDPPFLRRLKKGGITVDYIGIAMLSLGVGSLQILLDKGQEDDWFGSHFIVTLVVTAALCLTVLVIWEWFRKEPIIDVRLFKNFNYAAANVMMFMMGVMLFSTLVMIPEFLQTLMGYTAELAGLVLSASGFVLLLMMPAVGRLT
ncbi:MAG: DHA2 family efflux MFS transporter permease subunit, partial [Limisphaerales bacterium]